MGATLLPVSPGYMGIYEKKTKKHLNFVFSHVTVKMVVTLVTTRQPCGFRRYRLSGNSGNGDNEAGGRRHEREEAKGVMGGISGKK